MSAAHYDTQHQHLKGNHDLLHSRFLLQTLDLLVILRYSFLRLLFIFQELCVVGLRSDISMLSRARFNLLPLQKLRPSSDSRSLLPSPRTPWSSSLGSHPTSRLGQPRRFCQVWPHARTGERNPVDH